MINEDIAGQAPPAASAESDKAPQSVVVPEDKPVTEDVKSEDLSGGAASKSGGKFASLAPGDELTRVAESKGQLFTVYFDFDKYNIRDGDRESLSKNAKWLGLNSSVKVRIEGHADERGETEYNLALGDKRAKNVEKYLEDMGIKAVRLSTISYGEEKPADPGHDEDAWSKNRRAEFAITSAN
ncbi:MAG: peptidoglycan-associated lipoprotein Pal [Deltaproteobacteria bacterium]|nr:peptidoglycan-associated lipoprotein Pal [Deltaproteobacteria bacterium]